MNPVKMFSIECFEDFWPLPRMRHQSERINLRFTHSR